MNLKSGNIEGFEHFSQFSCLREFNTHIEMWLLEHKKDFSKAELVGLKRLVRFAAKIPGVCNAKIGTVLKAINEEYNDNGISRSTFKRMIQKAKEIGILIPHETERKNGSQSSNLYVFNRFPSNEPPKEEKLNHLNKTINPSKTNNQKIKERTEAPLELDHTFVSDRVPQEFVQLVKYFYPEAKTIEEYWKMAKIAAYRNVCEEKPEMLEIAIHSFKQLVNKIKTSKVKNPIAYFYGISDAKFQSFYYQELFEKYCH
jgi:hypothetical protein